ncbi:MAG: hypothetical protein MUO40_10865 [Anaerolineaceae bacterium]|nr:hypothetical protein [Anaerolineaceae bacterium]
MEYRNSLVKPTLDTPYSIDFEWWKEHDRDWRIYMRNFLCTYHSELLQDVSDNEKIDWIDSNTAEVKTVDAIQHTLITHCAKEEEFATTNSALVDSVFRLFLADGNKPLTCQELGEKLGKSPSLILRTFSSLKVYKGIRPA